MPAYRYACDRCHERTALAALTEVRPAVFVCDTCTRRGQARDMAPAAQAARDHLRDAQINAMRGAPIDQATRTRLNTWRARMAQQKHGGATW